jgi:hypothetical protein
MKLQAMKLRITKLRITVAVVAMFALAFTTCETEYIDTYVPAADLLSLRIGDILMSGTNVPVPVDNRMWDDDGYDITEAEYTQIKFKRDTEFNNARFQPAVSRGAKVKWGIASYTVRPNDFYDTRVPAIFSEGEFIYIMVTSEDNKITNYYRFSTYLNSPVKELSNIAIAGREADLSRAAPSSKWNGDPTATPAVPAPTMGSLNVTQAQAAAAKIDATLWDERSNLRYAKTPYAASVANREEPVFTSNDTIAFSDGDLLYVEVAAENQIDINIYLFRVYVGRIGSISKLTFINQEREDAGLAQPEPETGLGTFEAPGKGTAKEYWTDNSGTGSFESPHQPTAGFKFAVELDEVNGTWEYAVIQNLPPSTAGTSSNPHTNNGQPTWIQPGGNSGTPTVTLKHNEYLAIKVFPPNQAASSPNFYYKVKIGLLAADFTIQPKSHDYKANTGAQPLTFTLDRNVTNASYQWYEANSWYGGYGFDSVGRIGGKGAITANPDFGKDDKGTIDGIPYDVEAWHVVTLDEKNNVSLHNGGNQYYRLPTPGKPIPNASGTFSGNGSGITYTPPTNRTPFLATTTVETHYYWVEIIADNLKAVSKRAVIVTEWGTIWNLGQNTGTAEVKEHYIIDLYAYQTTGSKGLQLPPRNASPFTAGNHGDSYWIPVDFPEGFDILDYSIFTAQALFYLADGRPWIQNWTQGDIGFGRFKKVEKTDANGNVIKGEDGNPIMVDSEETEEIVLWYNLTSDNASRGLASSGNAGLSGAGSGLSETPQFIVVKPAGTKKINRLPPFNADGTPENTGDAQGWFTPYIELCEVRFEGPARPKPCKCDGKAADCTCGTGEGDCKCDKCE